MAKLYFSSSSNEAKRLSRLFREKSLRRIYRGIYTDDLEHSLESITQQNWLQIVAYVVPKGVLAYRTALDLKPTPFQGQSIVFVMGAYARTIQLPGLLIKIIKGNYTDDIEHILPNLCRTSFARSLLENLTAVKSAADRNVKTLGIESIERILVKELQTRKEIGLNQIRDSAKKIAAKLDYHKEYKRLNDIISALLATNSDEDSLMAKKEPYDPERLHLFEQLYLYLKKCNFIIRPYTYSTTSFRNISFFESYFSNFIEGTEFIIDEAEDIIFKRVEIYDRHEDSHDVLANFILTSDFSEMSRTPQSGSELIERLRKNHEYLMKERPDKHPGQFKQKPNRAGNTYFVKPDDVIGTLNQSFQYYQMLDPGLARALFLHFVICEVHPFSDGNGRLSRIMMNAEFVATDMFKIIIPTVHRDNYLNGLRLASRDHYFKTYCKVMDQAQAYVASFDWRDYGDVREKFETDYADKIADDGLPIFNRAIRQLELSEFE